MSGINFDTVNKSGISYNFLDLKDSKVFKIEMKYMIGADVEQWMRDVYDISLFGITHLLEHMSFKSTEDYTTEELHEVMNKLGKHNASTNFDYMNFWFKTSMDHYKEAISVVSNIVYNDMSRLKDDEFESEKSVVINELNRYADSKQTMFYLISYPVMIGNDRNANILGTTEYVKRVTKQDIVDLKALFNFDKKDLVINVTYDSSVISEDEVIKEVESKRKKLYKEVTSYGMDRNILAKSITPVKNGKYYIPIDSEQDLISILFNHVDSNYVTRYVGNRWINRLSNDLSIFNQFRDKHGLTYGGNLSSLRLGSKKYSIFRVDVKKDKLDFSIKLLKEIITNTYEAYTEDTHDDVIRTLNLNEKIDKLNLNNYEELFNIATYHKDYTEKIIDNLDKNFSEYYLYEYNNFTSYHKVKSYLKALKDLLDNDNYILITNRED